MMSGGDPALSLAEQILAQEDFYFFLRRMFYERKQFKWARSPHHKIICDALMRVYRGECKRLLINIPPRGSKTEIVVINFISWALGKAPDSEFIHTCYSSRLAVNSSWQARGLVQHAKYQQIFPRVVLRDDSQAKDEWRTTEGGVVYAVGAGGTITGYGAGKARPGFGGAIIIDDPIKAIDARSDVMRQNNIDWFQSTLESRTNSPDTPIIIIMQRLHENDLTGWLLDGGNGEEWEHVCCPAITEAGESLWEERWTIESLRRREKANPYVFAGQYMQNPAPSEGGIFKPDSIQIVEALPAGVEIEWIRGWDFAATIDGDYTAGAKLGRLPDNRYIIADMVHLRAETHERDAAIKNAAIRDGYNCTISIPQDPGQAGKTQVSYLVGNLAGYRVIATPETGDKITRASPLASQINVGNVMMLKAEWNSRLIAEMRLFPNARYDDQVDALSRAFSNLIVSRQARIFILGRDEEDTNAIEMEKRYCGNCFAYNKGICQERGFQVRAEDIECPLFAPADD